MKKKLSKGITALMLVFLLLPLKVHASGPAEEPEIAGMTEEEAAYYLRLCETGAGSLMRGIFTNVNLHVLKDDGQLMVVCATNTSEIASELGTKQLILDVKNGIFWIPVATLEKASRTNARSHSGGCYYKNPASGSTYRATGIHFAIINGKEYTAYAESGMITY